MARGEPAPRPAEPSRPEILPNQQTRLMAYVSTDTGEINLPLSACTSPLATATQFYRAQPELQLALQRMEIAEEVLMLVELQADGSRYEHWVRLGQATQVFINCDLMNAVELRLYLGVDIEIDSHSVYAVPFGSAKYYKFFGNADMLYNPKVDPEFSSKEELKKTDNL